MSNLGDLTVPKIDQSGPRKTGEFTYIDISSIDNKLKRIIEPKRLPGSAAPSRAKQRLQAGDVLVSMTRPNLNAVAIVPPDLKEAVGSTGFHVLRAVEGIESRWLLYAVQTHDFVEAMSNLVQGALYPAVRPKDIRAYGIEVPPLDQQRLIVAEIEKQFSRLDEAVVNLKRVKANLKRYKASVLKFAVEGKLTEDWRKQHPDVEPASKLLERILAERRAKWSGIGKYKEPTAPETSDLPELPDLWGWATMPQLGELNRGKSKHRPRNDLKLFGGPYPFIQTGDVKRSGGFVRSHSQTYNKTGLAQSRLWPTGTLCITIAANIAETGILSYPACFPDSIVGFVFDSAPVTVRFIDLFFRTEREEIARFAPATAQKNINLEILSEVAVPFPPLEEQKEIVAEADRRLSVIEELEALVEANLIRADHFRQSILQQAFSGRLKLTEVVAISENSFHMVAHPHAPHITTKEINMKATYATSSSRPRTLLDVIKEAGSPIAPEELFSLSGFDATSIEQVELFYAELNELVNANQVEELRPSYERITLRAMK